MGGQGLVHQRSISELTLRVEAPAAHQAVRSKTAAVIVAQRQRGGSFGIADLDPVHAESIRRPVSELTVRIFARALHAVRKAEDGAGVVPIDARVDVIDVV